MDPNTTEDQLAYDAGVKRSLLTRLRTEHLERGSDFLTLQSGVTYTESGIKKMMALLGPGPAEVLKKNGAARPEAGELALPSGNGAAAPTFTLRVLAPTFNGRCCHALIDGRAEPHRAYVKPTHRLGATTLSAGLRLEGCRRINDELFEYDGPVPVRLGQPLPPPRKEGLP